MIRNIIYSILGLILTYSIYVIFVVLANYESIYLDLRSKFAELGYKVNMPDIVVEHFPTPRILIKNVSIDEVVLIETLDMPIHPLSVLTLNPRVSSINVSNVRFYTFNHEMDFRNHERLVKQLIKRVPNLPKSSFRNVSIINNVSKEETKFKYINIDPESNSNQLSAKLESGIKFKVHYVGTSDGVKVSIDKEGSNYSLNISEIYRGGRLIEGIFRGKISNLKNYVDNEYPEHDFFLTDVNSDESVEVSANFEVDNDLMGFNDIKIKSKSIDMIGKIDLYDSNYPDRFSLRFKDLNLKTLMAAPNLKSIDMSKQKGQIHLDQLTRIFNVRADRIAIANTVLEDFTMDLDVAQNQVKVNEVKSKIKDRGEFKVTGNITQNLYRSMFQGDLKLKHSDLNEILNQIGMEQYATKNAVPFMLKSRIAATPIDYEFYNSFVKVGNSNIEGSSSFKFIGSFPRLNVSLSASSLDLLDENHPILSNIVSYGKKIVTESKSTSYLKKFIPIREVGFLGNVDLTFNDLKVQDEIVDKFRIITEVSPGSLLFSSIYYQDEKSFLSAVAHLSARGVQPEFRFHVGEMLLHTDKFNMNNIHKFLSSLRDDHDIGKVKISGIVNSANIKRSDGNLSDMHLKLRNDGILWNIDSIKAKYAGGTFESSGSLKLDKMNLNLAFAYNNFNLKALSSIFPFAIFGISDGWASANGVISTYGQDLNELLYNLYSKSSFQGRRFKLANLGIDKFVSKIEKDKYSPKDIDKDIKNIFSNNPGTMNVIDGEIELSKGLFKLSDLDFETNRAAAEGFGEYNLYDNNIGLDLKYEFTPRTKYGFIMGRKIKLNQKASGSVTNPKSEVDAKDLKLYFEQNDPNRNRMRRNNQRNPQGVDLK